MNDTVDEVLAGLPPPRASTSTRQGRRAQRRHQRRPSSAGCSVEVAEAHDWGEPDYGLLDLAEARPAARRRRRWSARAWSPHCARIHPAKLARGLAAGRASASAWRSTSPRRSPDRAGRARTGARAVTAARHRARAVRAARRPRASPRTCPG